MHDDSCTADSLLNVAVDTFTNLTAWCILAQTLAVSRRSDMFDSLDSFILIKHQLIDADNNIYFFGSEDHRTDTVARTVRIDQLTVNGKRIA